MVAEKEWTKTDPKDDKILALKTCLSKLDKNKTSFLETFQGGRGNRTQTCINTKGMYPNKICDEEINNL